MKTMAYCVAVWPACGHFFIREITPVGPCADPPCACLVPNRHVKGSATLVAALSKVPPHEEKRRQLTSLLRGIENQTRSDIAEAARSAAELR